MPEGAVPLIILGSTGRIGAAMRKSWPIVQQPGIAPILQARTDRPGYLTWDILHQPCPPGAASGVVLCLTGSATGLATRDASALAHHTALAMRACEAAAAQGARHVFLASSAAVYPRSDDPLTEETTGTPPGAYGEAKLAMERAALGWQRPDGPALTLLRIGNVAGFDALLGNARPGVSVALDPVAGSDGGPLRSYIGPVTLCAVLAKLAARAAAGEVLPKVLNIATPTPVPMAELLDAAGLKWHFGPENPDVLGKVALDTTRLQKLIELPSAAMSAAGMVAEWQELGV